MSDTDLSETRRRLDDLIAFAAEVHDAAKKIRDAHDAGHPFAPITDLATWLAPYHMATEDVPRDVVCAVLKAVAQCDLSKVKPLLGNLRSELTLADDAEFMFGPDVGDELAEANANAIISRLCDLIIAEDVWPQQVKR